MTDRNHGIQMLAPAETGVMFPPESWHNHASCITELPNGDMLACWYHGSGERKADDVLVEGARWPLGAGGWTQRFMMADTREYPDCNPCLFVDRRKRLWLVWVTILDNQWHTALLKYRMSVEHDAVACPPWSWSEVIHVTPSDSHVEMVRQSVESDRQILAGVIPEAEAFLNNRLRLTEDKLFRRLGWMPRCRATILRDGRIVLPLYSDGVDFSLMLLSDDDGDTWHPSAPLISLCGVQPSVVERTNGDLVAYLRDNGPAPNRMMRSYSFDRGETWTTPEKTCINNPGSGLEAIRLRDGRWLLVCNDTETERYTLAIYESHDEGETWGNGRYLANDTHVEPRGRYHYPSIYQARDGAVWVTWTRQTDEGNTIAWARLEL